MLPLSLFSIPLLNPQGRDLALLLQILFWFEEDRQKTRSKPIQTKERRKKTEILKTSNNTENIKKKRTQKKSRRLNKERNEEKKDPENLVSDLH